MRYLILTLFALVSVLLTGSVLVQWTIFGIQIDLILVFLLAMVNEEKTPMPILFFGIASVGLDLLFSMALGYYSLPYVVIGLLAYWVVSKWPVKKLIAAPIFGAVGWLIKELLQAFFALIQGSRFDFGQIFLTNTLPGALICGAFTFLAALLMMRLYKNTFMHPRSMQREDDLLL